MVDAKRGVGGLRQECLRPDHLFDDGQASGLEAQVRRKADPLVAASHGPGVHNHRDSFADLVLVFQRGDRHIRCICLKHHGDDAVTFSHTPISIGSKHHNVSTPAQRFIPHPY